MKIIKRAVYVILLCTLLCITGCSQSQKTDQAAGDEKPAVSFDASNAAGSEKPAASYVQMLDYNKDLTWAQADDNYRRTGERDILILANIGGQTVKMPIDPSFCRVLLNNADTLDMEGEGRICLEPFQAVVLAV